MNELELQFLQREQEALLVPFQDGDALAVPTHCMYSSGSLAIARVFRGQRAHLVTDGGGAIHETDFGPEVSHRDVLRSLRHIERDFDVDVADNGALMMRDVEAADLAWAITVIANASQAAEAALQRLRRTRAKRDLHREVGQATYTRFPSRVREGQSLTGRSNKQYTFDYCVTLGDGSRLLLDVARPEHSSIASKVMSHSDVAKAGHDKLLQRIVIDDAEGWAAEDISVLGMAADVVLYAKLPLAFDRLEAAHLH